MVRELNPGGGKIFRTCPYQFWGLPSLLYNGCRVFPVVKIGRGVTLTPHPLLVPWSWKGKAIPLLPLWAIRPVQSLSACTMVHFTFTYTSNTIIIVKITRKFSIRIETLLFLCQVKCRRTLTAVLVVASSSWKETRHSHFNV